MHEHCAGMMEMLLNSAVHMRNRPVSINKHKGAVFMQFIQFTHILST